MILRRVADKIKMCPIRAPKVRMCMAQCKKCGRKGFFLTLNSDGLCRQCLAEKEQNEKEAREAKVRQRAEAEKQELENAIQKYNETVSYYKKSGVDLAICSLADLAPAILAGETFCELLATWPSIPSMDKAIAADSDNFGGTYLFNNSFGMLKIREDSTICFDDIRDKVKRNCQKYSEIIKNSEYFAKQVASIPSADLPKATSSLFSRSTNTSPMKESNITKRTNVSSVDTFFVLDTETTGLSILTDEIIQISVIRFVNFQPVEALTSFVYPKNGLKPSAQKINHITEDDVEGAPTIEEVLPAFDAYLSEGIPIVGHNLSFDYNFLYANGSRVMVENMVGNRKFFDTLSLSKRTYTESPKYNLDYLCRTELGIIRSSAHNALSDALATGLLFSAICETRLAT